MKTLSSTFPLRSVLLMLCTAAICAAPVALSAQTPTPDAPPSGQQGPPPDGHGRGHMEEHRLEMMTKQLSLTADQVTSIKVIFSASRDQMMALRDDTSTTREQKRPKMEAIHKDEQAKIKAVLTDDQKVKFEAMEARMRERREEHRDHGDDAPPPPAPQP